jgi:tetratricopeptide (TPR) repeat protein
MSRSQPESPATIEEEQQQHHHHHLPEESYPQFLDSFQSLDDACSPLDIGRILLEDDDEDLFSVGDTFPSQDVSKPRHRAVKKDPYDEFMTAYTSQGHFGLDFDHLVSPTRFGSKVKIKKLTLPPNLNVSPAGSGTASRSEDVTEREHQCRKEQVFWDTTAATRSRDLGLFHHDTAEAFMSLGHAHLRLNEYDEAMEAFQTSCKIFNALDGPTHLSVGRALDAFGLAALRHYEGGTLYLIQAKTALEEAFAIRFHSLGVWHADTVETFNKIGTVYLHMGRLNEAADAYREVYLVRQAIYGSQHPSVAIVAHGLANILFNMRHLEEARNYFTVAFNIYQSMKLSNRHPAMVRLQVDQSRLLDCKPR